MSELVKWGLAILSVLLMAMGVILVFAGGSIDYVGFGFVLLLVGFFLQWRGA